MGNKRKASIIILTVFVAAIALFAGAYDILTRFNSSGSHPDKSGASAADVTMPISNGNGIITGTGNNCNIRYALNGSGATYMFIFAGQDGVAGEFSGGKGATCLAFAKNFNITNTPIGNGGGSGWRNGGGLTTARSNLALPSGTDTSTNNGWAYAAGGGGAGSVEDGENTARHAVFKSNPGVLGEGAGSSSSSSYTGRTAVQGSTDYSKTGMSFNYDDGYWTGGTNSYWVSSISTIQSSGGGAGYNVGEGGRAWVRNDSHNNYYSDRMAGGGGACSPNCYPIYSQDSVKGQKSTGNGYVRAYRIDPSVYPGSGYDYDRPLNFTGKTTLTAPSGIGSDRYTPATASQHAFGDANVLGQIQTAWVYSDDNGASWHSNVNDVALTGLGEKTIKCRYVIYATGGTNQVGPTYLMRYTSPENAAKDTGYVIYECTRYIYSKHTVQVTELPTANTLVYNANYQQLLATPGKGEFGMGYCIEDGDAPNDDYQSNGTWNGFKGKYAGNYWIECWSLTDGTNKTSYGDDEYVKITIQKCTPSLSPGSLKGLNPMYNGTEQPLFSGGGTVNAPSDYRGTVYYTWNLRSDGSGQWAGSGSGGDTRDVTQLTASEAADGSGNMYTYYLFYRIVVNDTANYSDRGWTYTGISTQIKKAEYTITLDQNADVPFDGYYHSIYRGSPIVKSPGGASKDWVDVSYSMKYTGNNGVVKTYSGTYTPDTTLNSVRDAGKYEFIATFTAKSSYRNNIAGNTDTKVFNVLKSSDGDIAKLTGLSYNTVSAYELDETATCKPFLLDGVEQKLDLTVGGVDLYNGLSTNNDNNYNTIGYLITKENGTPKPDTINDATGEPGFVAISAANLNEAITNMEVHKAGITFVWLNIVRHNSLADGTMFLAAQFTVNGFNDAMVKLQGLLMTGADAVSQDGKIDYDGLAHPVVKSGTAVKPIDSQKALILEDVWYAVSTFSNYAERPKLEWKQTPNDPSFFKKDVNTYYLWVKWGPSDNLQGTTGVIYAHMEIQQLVANGARFYFNWVGIDPGIWAQDHEINNSMMMFYTTYNNAEQRIGKPASETDGMTIGGAGFEAHLVNNINGENPNLYADLTAYGGFSFGVSTDISTMNGVYYPADEFSKVTVKNVGNYYLWVHWGGSANITAGETVYRIDGSGGPDPRLTLCFVVNQLTDNSDTELNFEVFDLGDKKEHEYIYEFLSTGTTSNPAGRYEGIAQALFSTNVTPSITINNQVYSEQSVSYKYMLTTAAADITPTTGKLGNNSGWVNSIDQAAMADVGQYYLWLLVTIDDVNVKLQKTFRVKNGDAKIIPTQSFVRIEPTALATMWTGERLDVVRKSGQIAPEVEYALFKYNPESVNVNEREVQINLSAEEIAADSSKVSTDENGWKWTKDVTANAMRPVDAGLYKLYFRGAAYGDMFLTQEPKEDGYSFILLEVGQTTAHISAAGMPKKLNVTYTGKPINTFTDGFAQTPNYIEGQTGGKSGIPLLYSWDNQEFYHYDELEKKINAGIYLLYFMPDTSDPDLQNDTVTVSTMTVTIAKAPILVNPPVTVLGSQLIYKADGYHLFIGEVDYAIVDTSPQQNTLTDESGTPLIYSRNDNGAHGGDMGTIYYALSLGDKIYPTTADWKTNYKDVVAQQTGSYYIWMKVDEGENHLSQVATCYNKNSPITIIAAQQYVNEDGDEFENVRLSQSSYKAARNGDNSYLRYDGLSKNLLKAFDLQIEVANRNDNGELEYTDDDQIEYNLMPTGDRLGRVYYALKSRPDAFPSLNDFSQDGWQTNWQTLNKADVGTYYLLVLIVYDVDSNIGQVQFCLTTLDTADGSERDELRILPAVHDMISVSGISGITKMYNNGPQKIAVGDLIVTIKDSHYDITDQVETAMYCYVNVTNNRLIPTVDSVWTPFADTMVKSVGKYQLYVYLKVVSDNLDSVTESLIFPLFFNPITLVTDDENYYAEITRADANNVTIVAPSFAQNLIYNGQDQCLIVGPARVEMKNKTYGAEPEGKTGTTYYYISSSKETITGDKTSYGGVKYSDYSLEGWLKEKHVGTYYIWVEFDEGVSYEAMAPICIGSVTIAQATDLNIALSGIGFSKTTYNGEMHTVFNQQVQQMFIDGGLLVDSADIFSIEYAYSSDPRTVPSDNDLWTIETDLMNLKARDAGKYYVWIRVTGKANEFGTYNNIANYMKCYCINEDSDYSEIFRANMNNSYIQGVVPHTGLVYIGKNQTLASISNDGGLKIFMTEQNLNTDEFNKDLDIRWGVCANPDDEPAETDFRINLSDVRAMNHGEYYLWVWVQESKNFNEYKACFKVINIDKGTIHFTQSAEGKNLVYQANNQELLNTPATIEFYAVGEFYDSETPYYAADEVTVEYCILKRDNIDFEMVWNSNYRDVQGFHAGKYKVQCRVLDADNWNAAYDEIMVEIKSVDASTLGVGLAEKPHELTDLVYNEEEKDLIDFGHLTAFENGYGSALEGAKIVFYYVENGKDSETKYYYYYENGQYVWGNNVPLLKRTNAGNYHIRYYVTGTDNGNYHDSDVYDLYITISKRSVYWVNTPKPISGLKYTGSAQPVLTPGVLNVGATSPCTAKGVKVMYSTKDQGPSSTRNWKDTIPEIKDIGFAYVWYYVWVDNNNEFVDEMIGADNDPSKGTMMVVSIEPYILSIRDYPQASTLMYTAEEQNLITHASLSTDDVETFGDNDAPYFEYRLEGGNWSRIVTGKKVDKYKVYYRVHYNADIFRFEGDDGQKKPLEVTIEIVGTHIETDTVRAVYDEEHGTIGYEIVKHEVLNESTGELELVPYYSDTFVDEFSPYINYWYRLYDEYNPNSNWKPWENGGAEIQDTLGTYQFMLTIEQSQNCYYYLQLGTKIPYHVYTAKHKREVRIIMPEKTYTTPAYVRVWIDFTGSMIYEDAKFKYEGWVASDGKLEIPFKDVDSAGANRKGVIRVQTANANYYYMSETPLSNDEKSKIKLSKSRVLNTINAFNRGGLMQESTDVYIYEVYMIQYYANTGKGDKIDNGFKWHRIDYLLEENNFKKTDKDGTVLPANGWNTTPSGNGNSYGNGFLYYREDASQRFYAQYVKPSEKYYSIEWIIRKDTPNGTLEYALSRDTHVWFDVAKYQSTKRTTGMLIAGGEVIVLPQVTEDEDHNLLSDIFGGYIKYWHAESEEDLYYRVGMTAERHITFVAELNDDLDDWVQCEFLDDQGTVIHTSGKVANGAEAYMALSGMSATTIKSYRDGFDKWVDNHQTARLDRTYANGEEEGVITYDFGTKRVIEEPTSDDGKTAWSDYIVMIVILILGLASTVASLIVYIIMRKKHRQSAVSVTA